MPNETKPAAAKTYNPTKATTDREYADAFLLNHLNSLKTVGDKWYEYDCGLWRERPKEEFQPIIINLMHSSHQTAHKMGAVMSLLQGMCQVPFNTLRGAYYKEGDAIHFNLLNGILSVTQTTRNLREHDKSCYFTKAFDVHYLPAADCPLYMRVLHESLPDESDRTLLQLCFGNFLLPDCRFHTALVCYGNSGCGKSTLADPVAQIFGSADNRLITNLSLAQICDPDNYSTPYLLHASVNLSTELQAFKVADSGIFKQLVFGEAIAAREIRGKPFSMKSNCKFWFNANSLPNFDKGTQAEINRIKFIRFDKKPAVEDQSLKERLPRERSGIFNFMLDGLQKLMVLPKMPDGGEASRAATARFATVNDCVVDFITKHCRMGPDLSVNKQVLKEAYKEYLEDNNFAVKVNDYFFRLLKDRFPELADYKRRNDDGTREPRLRGIEVIGDMLAIAQEKAARLAPML